MVLEVWAFLLRKTCEFLQCMPFSTKTIELIKATLSPGFLGCPPFSWRLLNCSHLTGYRKLKVFWSTLYGHETLVSLDDILFVDKVFFWKAKPQITFGRIWSDNVRKIFTRLPQNPKSYLRVQSYPRGGRNIGISGWGCAAGTLEPWNPGTLEPWNP